MGVNGITANWMGTIEVEGKNVAGVVDTGSSITVLPEHMIKTLGVVTVGVQRVEARVANGTSLLLTEETARAIKVRFQGKEVFTKLYFSPEVDNVYIGWDVCACIKNGEALQL